MLQILSLVFLMLFSVPCAAQDMSEQLQEEAVQQQAGQKQSSPYKVGPFEKAVKRAMKKNGWHTGGVSYGGYRSHVDIKNISRGRGRFAPRKLQKPQAEQQLEAARVEVPENEVSQNNENWPELVEFSTFRDCKTCPEMVVLPENFVPDANLAIGRFEISHAEFEACVKDDGCLERARLFGTGTLNMNQHITSKSDEMPQTHIRGVDVLDYIAWLRKKTGQNYRLPTQQEWYEAARANRAENIYPWGEVFKKNMAACRHCRPQVGGRLVAVGRYPANGFGLYDMAGNVAEWVGECVEPDVSLNELFANRGSFNLCAKGILMGGSWLSSRDEITVTSELPVSFDDVRHDAGFRVVTELENVRIVKALDVDAIEGETKPALQENAETQEQ